MNRFEVIEGKEEAFERRWRRESKLEGMDGSYLPAAAQRRAQGGGRVQLQHPHGVEKRGVLRRVEASARRVGALWAGRRAMFEGPPSPMLYGCARAAVGEGRVARKRATERGGDVVSYFRSFF